jgi:hypothetical protein
MLVLGFSACSDYEEVIIHHEPYLNIFANVTAADKSFNFVNVYRTTAFGEPDNYEIDSIIYHQFYNESSGDTITYETFYIDTSYAVNDAKVYFLHQSDTIKFKESIQGIYHPVDTNYTIITGDEYELYVETEDFGIATAVEEALPPINWPQAKDDTIWISLSNPVDTLWWSDLGGAYYVRFLRTYHYRFGSYTYPFTQEQVREPFWAYDTSNYDELFNYDPFANFLDSDYNPDTLELEVVINAFDDAFLDYISLAQMQWTTGFIRYPTINDFRVNIDNSLGAFTSSSESEKRVVMFVK